MRQCDEIEVTRGWHQNRQPTHSNHAVDDANRNFSAPYRDQIYNGTETNRHLHSIHSVPTVVFRLCRSDCMVHSEPD